MFMKIIYIVSSIKDSGGIGRILSYKLNYLIEKNYEIEVVCQEEPSKDIFYNFNPKIIIHYISKGKNTWEYFINYKQKLHSFAENHNTSIFVVCDFGWKGFLTNYILHTKIPVIFEVHGSVLNENSNKYGFLIRKIRAKLRKFLLNSYSNVVFESENSKEEWNFPNNYRIIPNPIHLHSTQKSSLQNSKVMMVSRHSYEKGVDRMLSIWAKINAKYPNWTLEIYGDGDLVNSHKIVAKKLYIESSVSFFKPIINIEEKYVEASIFVLTSRSEGFGIVLVEAMSFGIPVVAYDCPIGPRSIISNTKNGFLIKDGNEQDFVNKMTELIENFELRKQIGTTATEVVLQYNLVTIMDKWEELFNSLILK